MGLFWRNPSDIIYLLLFIIFSYFYGLIKLYAFIMINKVLYIYPVTLVLILIN